MRLGQLCSFHFLYIALFLLLLGPFQLYASESKCADEQVYFEKKSLCVKLNWIEGPILNPRRVFEPSSFTLEFSPIDQDSEKKKPVEFEGPFFYLWMKMPGAHEHGARPVKFEKAGPNKYQINNAVMSQMPGQWFIRLKLEHSHPHDQRKDYDLEVPLTEWSMQ